MSGTSAKIEVIKNDNILSINLHVNDELSRHETRVDYDNAAIDALLPWWMLKSVKTLFSEMPLDRIDTICSKDVYQQFGKGLEACAAVIKSTNDAVTGNRELRGIASDNENVLFFNIDDNYRYRSLCERLCKTGENKLLCLNIESGFNPKIRSWESQDIPMSLSELTDIIIKENIQKIVSINHYFLEKYLHKANINLIALFQYLGIEYIIIDNDIWDDLPHGYLMKSFFHCNSFNRFTLGPLFNKYWDNKYELEKVHYITIPQDYKNDKKIRAIKDDYAILVLSNSRLDNVKPQISPILYLLDHMPKSSVFVEAQRWYLALKFMILNIMRLDELERLTYNNMLHTFFYTVMQLLKYEIIESIDTKREIEIYGDIGWQIVFPQYYKKYIKRKEIDVLFSTNRHLYLLLNYVLSYLEASGSVYDAIKRKVPFINLPALVKTGAFEGFRCIEYGNVKELNYLIENIREVFDSRKLRESIRIYTNVLNDSVIQIEEKLVRQKNTSTRGGMFEKEWKEYGKLLDQTAEEYIEQNEPFLRETFAVLFQGKPVQYDVSESKYSNRNYVQRILRSIEVETPRLLNTCPLCK